MSYEIVDKTKQFPFKLNDESQSVSDKDSYGLDLLGFVREVPMLTTEESQTTPTKEDSSESKPGAQSTGPSSSLVLEGKKVIIKTNSMSGEKSLIFKQKTGQHLEIPARHCSFVKTSDTTLENAGRAFKVIKTHFSRNSPPPLEPIVAPRLKPTLLKPKSDLQYEIINKSRRNKEGANANNLLYRSRKDIQVYHWVTLPQSTKGRKLKGGRRRVRRTTKTDNLVKISSDPHYQIINKIRRRILKREQSKSESESDKACSPSEGSKSPSSSDCSKDSRDSAPDLFEGSLGNNDKSSADPAETSIKKEATDTKLNTYVVMLGDNQLLQKDKSQTPLNIGKGQMLHSLLRMPPPLRKSVVKADRAVQTPDGKSEVRSVGINTDESLFEEFLNKKLQEKLDVNEAPHSDRIESCSVVSSDDLVFDFCNFFDESSAKTNPIIGHNANFGNGPVMVGKSTNNRSESVHLTDISYSCGKNISNGVRNLSADGREARILEPWRIQFFLDLKHCNRFDSNGNMPLHVAVIEDNINRVRRQCLALRVRNISIDTFNHNSLTALQLGLLYDTSVSVLQTLITHSATPTVCDLEGNSVLHLAVLHSSDEAVQMLLGTCPNIPVDASNFEGDTALILCVLHKKYVKADRILQAGADPNIGDKKSGRTPLFHAIEANDVEMVKILLNYKAQTKVRNFFGTSPHDAMYELDSVDRTIRRLVLNIVCPPFTKKPQKGNKKRKAPDRVANNTKTIRIDIGPE